MSKPRQSAPDGRDAVLLEQMNEDLLAAVAELRAMIQREEGARLAKYGSIERVA